MAAGGRGAQEAAGGLFGGMLYKEIGQIHKPYQQKTTSGNSSADPDYPADPAYPDKVMSASAPRNLLLNAPGVRMT